jgi:succinate dehydrogenase/fumarate reductase flavoprotein subunit
MKKYYHTIILGTGAASLCAAVRLKRSGIDDILIVTDNLMGGTSRNTGSDKQTYYKLSDSTLTPDTPYSMAKALSGGGAMHGDIALAEALGSESGFYHLTALGVPFPFNKWGGYTGYKTDHDPLNRGTSLGPYTSRVMVEFLEKEVNNLQIPILDHHDCVKLSTINEGKQKRIAGIILLDKKKSSIEEERFVSLLCDNLIFGVGGPGGLYKSSVYPSIHVGSLGLALEAGAETANLTESQYGIGSLKFRWNLSGSFQQVLPRYYSKDRQTGEEYPFLNNYFSSMKKMTEAIFLKGYQWPFDPRKVSGEGSSLIDILVYQEMEINNRDVFMDFRTNPEGDKRLGEFNPEDLAEEVSEYWKKSGLTGKNPIERLEQLNRKAISLYKDHNIDLYKEPLQIGVCAQHNNGGLAGDIWWESTNISHFFPIGEVNGSHGVYRPGGTALNSGQVGAFRASQKIAHAYKKETLHREKAENELAKDLIEIKELTLSLLKIKGRKEEVRDYRKEIQSRMSLYGAFVRNKEGIEQVCHDARLLWEKFSTVGISSSDDISYGLKNRHMVLSHLFYLEAIKDYLNADGGSRGSYIIKDRKGQVFHKSLGEDWKGKIDMGQLNDKIQHLYLYDGQIKCYWEPCRPIPQDESWFETVWNSYLEGDVFQ